MITLSVTNRVTNATIDFEQDGPKLSIEVVTAAPSGNETAFFYLTRGQVRELKAIIDEAINQPQGSK